MHRQTQNAILNLPPTAAAASKAGLHRRLMGKTIRIMTTEKVRLALVMVLLTTLTAPAVADARAFTFSDAEFMRSADGLRAARTFVAEELPRGLSMSEAVARMKRAGTACPVRSQVSGTVRCRYFITVRPDGGDLGEDVWTVRLIPSAGGLLQEALLSRTRVGMEGLRD